MNDESIVLLSPDGHALGSAPKALSHHHDTPLHLAFSCYLVDEAGCVLITRRARHKPTFPWVWTNSCCGHPLPGEGLRAAVRRRVQTELGVDVDTLTLVLPGFRYRATMANGVMENELCPVVRATTDGTVRPNPDEVAEAGWRDWDDCRALAGHPDASPWYRIQLEQLRPLGSPGQWPAADARLLPPAVTW